MDYETYNLGTIELQSGKSLENAQIAYKTYGILNNEKDNVIVYPTWYSGFISDNEWLIGEGMALDPNKYFIIIICLFGNGQSSSPSNHPNFSPTTLYDNVVQQHRLVTEVFEIKKIKLVVGWSMGAQQSYQWACLYPDMVERVAPFAGSAKTAPHNFVFLEGIKAALTTDPKCINFDVNKERPEHGIRSFARVYAGWGFSQPFYKQELWRKLGFNNLEDFLTGFWETFFLKRDHRNLLAHIWTWQHGDISANPIFDGDFEKALGAIKAKTLLLCPEIDLYFPPDDNKEEMKYLHNGQMIIIPGVWGHFAGGGINKKDTDFIDKQLKYLLEL